VCEVIEYHFGVQYHVDHVWRVLHALGWTCQKPEQRARERTEATIDRWRGQDWPRIKKGALPAS
jgi:transposase